MSSSSVKVFFLQKKKGFSILQAWRQTPADEGTPENLPSELCMSAKAAHSEVYYPRMWSYNGFAHDGHDARGAILKLLRFRALGDMNQWCGIRSLFLIFFVVSLITPMPHVQSCSNVGVHSSHACMSLFGTKNCVPFSPVLLPPSTSQHTTPHFFEGTVITERERGGGTDRRFSSSVASLLPTLPVKVDGSVGLFRPPFWEKRVEQDLGVFLL